MQVLFPLCFSSYTDASCVCYRHQVQTELITKVRQKMGGER